MRKLILASQSPRRKELLEKCGYPFIVMPSDIEETIDTTISLDKAIEKLAYFKANAIFKSSQDAIVIGSDTIVTIDNKILGKPKNEQDAFYMLHSLSNRTHKVITGLSILTKEKEYFDVSINEVSFYEMSDEEIKKYISTKEPMDKAGAYAIQGIASRYIKNIHGDYYAIMGLPISKVYRILKEIYND